MKIAVVPTSPQSEGDWLKELTKRFGIPKVKLLPSVTEQITNKLVSYKLYSDKDTGLYELKPKQETTTTTSASEKEKEKSKAGEEEHKDKPKDNK